MTCREKCRKCDRGRPSCQRCISKGLVCRGYPDQFRFCGIASRGKWKDARIPAAEKDVPSQVQVVQAPPQEIPNSGEEQLNMIISAGSTPPMPEPRRSKRLTIDAMLVDSAPVEEDITTLLKSSQTKALIHHCKAAKWQYWNNANTAQMITLFAATNWRRLGTRRITRTERTLCP